jgi:sulfate adenylyltransferase subunit 1
MNAPHERFVNQSNALVLEPTPFDGNAGSSTESARSESSNRSNESKPAAAPLRIMTAGSVDDGKSTLIGRLMYDLHLMTDDILDDLRAASRRNGRGELDLSLFTDGLMAEREQGITIDVAYRYFNHQGRPFILCDSPGHVQYTRNMVCAASQADVALIMIDARHGPTEQSLRHLRIAQWLRVPSIVFVINKMDLVAFSQARYLELVASLRALLAGAKTSGPEAQHQGQQHFEFIPVVAVDGDNIVTRSHDANRLGWYIGPSLIDVIEASECLSGFKEESDFRFTVQLVARPTGREAGDLHDFRGLAGRVESGLVRIGESVAATSPEGTERTSTISGIYRWKGNGMEALSQAEAGQCVTLTLSDDLDISRGDTLYTIASKPVFSRSLNAQLCWMSEVPARVGQRLLLKQGARTSIAKIEAITATLDLQLGQFRSIEGAQELKLNEVANVRLVLAQSLLSDAYIDLPRTGSLLVLEPNSLDSLAAGIVVTA